MIGEDIYISCNTCACADQVLGDFVRTLPEETSFHRVEGQSVKCGFGLQGICCRLCANGPCRITPEAERGVCGADSDTIVARNFIRAVAAGSGCYIHVVENAAMMLKNTAKAGLAVESQAALERLAGWLGVPCTDKNQAAERIADLVLEDIARPSWDQMKIVEKIAYAPRYERWKQLGILPGGAKSEVFDGVVKSSTNLSSDSADMMFHCLRLGILTGLYGLTLTNLINDILMGQPELKTVSVGLRVVDPDYVNIMVTGHQQALFHQIQKYLKGKEAGEKARQAGAKGIRLVGCTCVGQDMQLRGVDGSVFSGHAGNNFTSEAILSTGAIDGVVSEFNCTLPGIEAICDHLDIRQICLDPLAKKANAKLIPYRFETREEDVEQIVDEMLDSYKKRRSKVTIRIPEDHGNDSTLTGVSELSLKKFLGGSWKPLIDLIASGEIKGIAGMVGCSSVAYGHDVLTVGLTKELIKRNILVLSAGCSSGGLENCGLMMPKAASLAGDSLKMVCEKLKIPPVLNFGPCLAIGRLEITACEIAAEMGIDLPKLPLVLSAAQWLEEQALADGAFGLALGLTLHLGVPPFMTGSPFVTQLLTSDLAGITGGKLVIDSDPVTAADQLESIIIKKRKDLGL